MIIERVGDTWLTGYRLSNIGAEEAQDVRRNAVVAQAGGADGAYDFYGDDPFPLASQEITRTLTLKSDTYHGIDKQLDELKRYTVGQGRFKVWGGLRDGVTHRWAWAKCTGLSVRHARENLFQLSVTLRFYLNEGIWHSEARRNMTFSNITYAGDISILNMGIRPAIPVLQVDIASPGRLIGWRIRDNSDFAKEVSLNSAFFSEDPALRAVRMLIDCETYQSRYWVNDTSDPPVNGYQAMAIGILNIPWFELRPGLGSYRMWFERTDSSAVSVTVSFNEPFL